MYHVPPVVTPVPSAVNMSTWALVLQSVMEPFVPAKGAGIWVTTTVAASLAQGGVPTTVYVYVPAVLEPGT